VLTAALRQLARDPAGNPARPLYLRPPDVTMPKRREPVRRQERELRRHAVAGGRRRAARPAACRLLFRDPWDGEALGRILALSGGFGFVAWEADTPVGFALARDLGNECEILSLGVLPEFRRGGVGRALLRAVIDPRRHGRGCPRSCSKSPPTTPPRAVSTAAPAFVAAAAAPAITARW